VAVAAAAEDLLNYVDLGICRYAGKGQGEVKLKKTSSLLMIQVS